MRRRAGSAGQRLEGGRHRRGVGVVGVVEDDGAARRRGQLHPPARQRASLEAPHDRGFPDALGQAGGRRRQRVLHLVATAHPERDLGALPRRRQHEGRPQLVVEREVLGPHVAALAEGDHGRLRCAPPWPRRADRRRSGSRCPRAGSASTSSPLARAMSSMVPNSSVCTGATRVTMPTVGTGDRAQLRDVADASGAHLHDDGLRAIGRVEQREGHAELVVERLGAGRGDEPLAEDAGEEVLHRGLAHRARDPEHRARQPGPREAPRRLQGRARCRRRRSRCRRRAGPR